MKIGIDISQIVYEGTGVARFTEGLINEIVLSDKKNEWLFFFSSFRRSLKNEFEEKIINHGHKLIKWKIPPTILSFLFNDLHTLSKLFIFNSRLFTSLDWFITSDWTEPLSKFKKATVIHDLVFLRYPETVHKRILRTQKKRLDWVKKESALVFCDSHATKTDLIELLHFKKDKIHVIYPGVEIRRPDLQKIKRTLKKFRVEKKIILTVGKLEPRKNIQKLIEAFDELHLDEFELLIVGPHGWGPSYHKKQNVRFLGFVNDEELAALYSASHLFVYPSLWEGFGYPVVEAMKLGVPVAVSNTSSVKEIGVGAAFLFNPFDVDDIKDTLHEAIYNENKGKEFVQKAYLKTKSFTWKNYYHQFIEILENYSI